jgi:beta-lactamase regulating signal transducer with metallopeptidase domain
MTYELLNTISFYGLATLLIKAGVIIMISYSLYDQFEFSPASIKHNIWLLTFISLALLPLLSATLPSIEWPILSGGSPITSSSETSTYSQTGNNWFSLQHLLMAYLAIAGIKLIRLIYEVFNISNTSSKAQLAPKSWQQLSLRLGNQLSTKKTIVKISGDIESPLTWGNLVPVILLPQRSTYWPKHELTMVMMHELAHIQRRDWLSQLLAQLVCILYWPIPGIQGVLNKMSLEAECSADDEVLRQGNTAPDYSSLLVKQARITHLQASVALGKPSELNLRVHHIINTHIDRSQLKTLRRVLISCCWLSLMPLAAIKTTANIESDPFSYLLIGSSHRVKTTKIINNELDQSKPSISLLDQPFNKPIRPTEEVNPPSFSGEIAQSLPRIKPQALIQPNVKITIVISKQTLGTEKLKPMVSLLPTYPSIALNKNIEGYVIVEFDIDDQGIPKAPALLIAAIAALKNRY